MQILNGDVVLNELIKFRNKKKKQRLEAASSGLIEIFNYMTFVYVL